MAEISRVALIPARGGSKRIPGKNVVRFFGHPMIAYAITAARRSGLFSRVVVSTDDVFTGRVAEWYGAECVTRPAELATDKAGLAEVGLHLLEALSAGGFVPGLLCLLMPNCPLRRAEDVTGQHDLFVREGRRFQISAVPYVGVYPHWALGTDAGGRGSWLFGDRYLVPSQELGHPLCPTGAVWWVSVPDFRRQGTWYGNPFHVAPMDPLRGLDIDTRQELELANLVVRGLRDRDGAEPLEIPEEEPFPEEA